MTRISILITILLSWTQSAYALINAEALIGKRWYHSENSSSSSFQGREIGVGVNVDPIPFVPVSLGLSYSEIALGEADLGGSPLKAEINQIGIDLKAWLSMVPVITPYVRARYIISSKLKVSYNNTSLNTDTMLKGYSLGLGIDYKIFLLLHAILEFNHAWETFSDTNKRLDSNSLLIGLQLGI